MKKKIIILVIIVLISIIGIIAFMIYNNNSEIKFYNEFKHYGVKKKNNAVYIDEKDLKDILKKDGNVILIGNSKNKETTSIIKYLDSTIIDYNKKLYYCISSTEIFNYLYDKGVLENKIKNDKIAIVIIVNKDSYTIVTNDSKKITSKFKSDLVNAIKDTTSSVCNQSSAC